MGTSPDEKQQQHEALAFKRFERAMLAAIAGVQGQDGIIVELDFDTVTSKPLQQDQQGEV